MEKIKFEKIMGRCNTPCPYHEDVMVGSIKCEECTYLNNFILEHGNTYALCRFKELADENKETQTNSFGNRLKVEARDNEDVGYIDGYVSEGGIVYAIVYYPLENKLKPIRINDLFIYRDGE